MKNKMSITIKPLVKKKEEFANKFFPTSIDVIEGRAEVIAQNVMYSTTNGNLELFMLNDDLEKTTEYPFATLEEKLIERYAQGIPSCYFPCMVDYAPKEIKAAYHLLKDLGEEGKLSNAIIDLYMPDKQLACRLNLLLGR